MVRTVLHLLYIYAIACGKSNSRPSEQVIHHPIELRTIQPLPRISPNFPDNVSFWIDGFDAIAKLLPKPRSFNLERHIQAPTIDAELNPIFGNLHDVFPYFWIVMVEYWQCPITAPTFIVSRKLTVIGRYWPIVNFEPIDPRGMGAIFQNIVEKEKAATGMVKYPIQNHLNISLVAGV